MEVNCLQKTAEKKCSETVFAFHSGMSGSSYRLAHAGKSTRKLNVSQPEVVITDRQGGAFLCLAAKLFLL